jgi:lysophospholipase L1-like esterase
LAARINLPEGARLAFLGDSLTDFYRGRNYVDLVSRACASKFGDRVSVMNAAIGGNNIKQIEARLAHDVLDKKPTHVFIFEGANDCMRTYDPATGLRDAWVCPVEAYEAAYSRVIEKIKEAGSQAIIMTMAPGDQRILEPFRRRAKDHRRTINFFSSASGSRR